MAIAAVLQYMWPNIPHPGALQCAQQFSMLEGKIPFASQTPLLFVFIFAKFI